VKPSEALQKVAEEIGPLYPAWAQLLKDTNNSVKPMETLSLPLNSSLLNVNTTVTVTLK